MTHLTDADKKRLLAAAHHKLQEYRSTLEQLFGANFLEDARYQQMLHEIAFNHRTPSNVVADYTTG